MLFFPIGLLLKHILEAAGCPCTPSCRTFVLSLSWQTPAHLRENRGVCGDVGGRGRRHGHAHPPAPAAAERCLICIPPSQGAARRGTAGRAVSWPLSETECPKFGLASRGGAGTEITAPAHTKGTEPEVAISLREVKNWRYK